jgi:hypothetical protein
MTGVGYPERRLLMTADMERYSGRGNLQQYAAQRAFRDMLERAAAAVGLAPPEWRRQETGDGELAALPSSVPEPVVLGRLLPELDRLLREHNRSLLPEAKVRLRVAVHQGLVHLDGPTGWPGNAVIEVCRLLDAQQLRRALREFPRAAVAVIVSEGIFRDVVAEHYEGLRPERFREVDVSIPDKNFRASAWIYVVDEDVTNLNWDDPAPAGPPEAKGAAPEGDRQSRGGNSGDIRTGDASDVSGIMIVGHGASLNTGSEHRQGGRR